MKTATLAGAFFALTLTAGSALAANVPTWTEFRGVKIADSHHLKENVVALKLVEMGYESISDYESDQGLWKVYANKDGQGLAVWVNPYFGNVVKEEPVN